MMYSFTEKHWCIAHHSVSVEGSRRCAWDVAVGPRPGRADCEFRRAAITVEALDYGAEGEEDQ